MHDGRRGLVHRPLPPSEHRWFFGGTPTVLVRDGWTTSQDPHPATPDLEEPAFDRSPASVATDDLRRGGEEPGDSVDPVGAVWGYVASRTTAF